MKLEAGNYTLHEVSISIDKINGGLFDGSMLFLTKEEDASKTFEFIDGWYGTPKELIRHLNMRDIDTIVIGWESTDVNFVGNRETESEDGVGLEEPDYMFHFVEVDETAFDVDASDGEQDDE